MPKSFLQIDKYCKGFLMNKFKDPIIFFSIGVNVLTVLVCKEPCSRRGSHVTVKSDNPSQMNQLSKKVAPTISEKNFSFFLS